MSASSSISTTSPQFSSEIHSLIGTRSETLSLISSVPGCIECSSLSGKSLIGIKTAAGYIFLNAILAREDQETVMLNYQYGANRNWAPIKIVDELSGEEHCVFINTDEAAAALRTKAARIATACYRGKFNTLVGPGRSIPFEDKLDGVQSPNFVRLLSQAQVNKIIQYIKRNLFQFSALAEQQQVRYFYKRPQDTGLDRSITMEAGRVIVHFNRRRKFDPSFGEGSFKKIHTGCVFPEGNIIAIASCAYKANVVQEFNMMMELAGCPGIARAYDMKIVIGKGGREKVHIEQPLYDGDLDSYIRKNNSSLLQKLVITKQLLVSLNELAKKGILHRDIKPENFFCKNTPHGVEVALGDFGLSCFNNDEEKRRKLVGTPAFIAPEMATIRVETMANARLNTLRQGINQFQEEMDENIGKLSGTQCDLWGLGCVLYTLLYRKDPVWFLRKQDYENHPAYLALVREAAQNNVAIDRQKFTKFCKDLQIEKIDERAMTEKENQLSFFPEPSDPIEQNPLEHLLHRIFYIDPSRRITIDEIFEQFMPIINGLIDAHKLSRPNGFS